jgi:heme/copper-type cytochrome/quinol oxidase subunit 3
VAELSPPYDGPPLPVGSKGRLSSGWWGMWTVLATEGALFSYLFFAYYYTRAHATGPWPPGGPPKVVLAVAGTVLLLLGSLTMWWGERGIRAGDRGRLLAGLGSSILIALLFLALEAVEWSDKAFSLSSSVYGSFYFTITGLHMLHVAAGVLMLTLLFVWTLLRYFGARRHSTVSIAVLYWHFVAVLWILVFLTFYVVPFLDRRP